MTALLRFAPHPDAWMAARGEMTWLCRCGAEVSVTWTVRHELYDIEEPIGPEHGITAEWRVECNEGHVLLLCHEVAENESADTFEPPTTLTIVERLADSDDVSAWLRYVLERAERATG